MRDCGILMHITSLPSPYGVGTMGKEAREFVDFLKKSGQKYWQVLPLCPTGYGDSPYSSFSTFAGNPYMIDLDMLAEKGLLDKGHLSEIDWEGRPDRVNFEALYKKRFKVLKPACDRVNKKDSESYQKFKKANKYWLDDYALFMAIKNANGDRPWSEWKDELQLRRPAALKNASDKYSEDVRFYKALQYLFYMQWRSLKKYANENGIKIIGDLPIYVAYDSADVWSSPENFLMDKDLTPVKVAGCPPDAFSTDGQLWGNPIYNWKRMKRDRYSWWVKRLKAAAKNYDVIRIDHFRGFSSFYTIPFGEKTARNGKWVKGPGEDFFKVLKKKAGDVAIIAEDLGFIDDGVRKLLKNTGFPGMKILEFGFDGRDGDGYMPHQAPENSVFYTGTHDNDTALGWYRSLTEESKERTDTYLGVSEDEGINFSLMRGAWVSPSKLAMVQAQDVLGLGSEARMNTPSTLSADNWSWRAQPGSFTKELAEKLKKYCQVFGRVNE
jgi:4-alpha-glucanotransferase